MNKIKSLNKQEVIVCCGFIICMIILLWRCFYSVNYADEPYCIASVWRFYKGDALLAEDWFPAQQLIAWVLYPLYWLFRLFSDSNDGIMLASRLAYVLFQGSITVVMYCRLKKYGNYRVPAAMLYLLFTQNNMLTLNYNTLGTGCMILILTLLISEEKLKKSMLIFVGILTAIMVLSQPYAIFMFGVWGIIVLIAIPFSRKMEIHPMLNFRNFFWVGIGAFLVLLAFGTVVLSRAGISELQTGMRYLMSDPEHQMDWNYKVTKYFERFYRYYKYQIIITGICMVAGVLKDGIIGRILKTICGAMAMTAAIYSLVYHGIYSDYVPIDFIAVPMTFLGSSIYFLGRKKHNELFFGWVLPALLYTFCVQLTTNTGILAVSSACIVASAGGVLLLGTVLEDERNALKKFFYYSSLIFVIIVFLLQGALLMYHRIQYTWWSNPVNECTERLDKGPAKGLYTGKEDAAEYYEILNAIDHLQLKKDDKILFLDLDPWLYLYADLPASTYSLWTIGEENFLDEYYKNYPGRMPTVICWMDAENEEEAVGIHYFLDRGYVYTESAKGIALRK